MANLRLHTIITPDNPDTGYLIWGLKGQDDLGNPLVRMPLGGQLEPSEMEAIRQWITDGAPEF